VPMVDTIDESLVMAKIVQEKLGELIKEKYGIVKHGDEGGYAIPESDIRVPLLLLSEAVETCGYKDKIRFALDVAATSFYDKDKKLYIFAGREYSKETLRDIFVSLAKEFQLLSIEDPFFEEDFSSFALLQEILPSVYIVGDDLTVTNRVRVARAVEEKSIKGLIIKPNQIGTLTETIETIVFAQSSGIYCIVSHRSGETLDDMIADITVAFNCFGMKSGARGPREREVKYERLSHIMSRIINK
jgi:enolase